MKDNCQSRIFTSQPQNQNRNNQIGTNQILKNPKSCNCPNNMNLNNNQVNFQNNKMQSGNFNNYNNFSDNNFNNNNGFNNNNFFNNNIMNNNNIQNNLNSNTNNLYNNNGQTNMNLEQINYEDDDTLKFLRQKQIINQNIKNSDVIFHQTGNFDGEILNEIKDICTSQFNLKNLSETKIDDKIAQRIRQKYGGEWFVLICELSLNKEQEDFDFKFTNIPRKNIIIFTQDNFRFYVCKIQN